MLCINYRQMQRKYISLKASLEILNELFGCQSHFAMFSCSTKKKPLPFGLSAFFARILRSFQIISMHMIRAEDMTLNLARRLNKKKVLNDSCAI